MKKDYFKIEKINTLCKGKYLEIKEVFYKYKDKNKRWEVCNSFNSVSVLIYHKEKDAIILVKQFRLPLYLKNEDGYAYELCAGLCDKDLSLEEIAAEEVFEEVGFKVEAKDLKFITTTWGCVGNQASRQDVFYVEVDDSQKVSDGGGLEDEDIEVVYVDVDKLNDFIFDKNIVLTPGAKMALLWFLLNKKENG